jgi:RHS repeat-associated protein
VNNLFSVIVKSTAKFFAAFDCQLSSPRRSDSDLTRGENSKRNRLRLNFSIFSSIRNVISIAFPLVFIAMPCKADLFVAGSGGPQVTPWAACVAGCGPNSGCTFTGIIGFQSWNGIGVCGITWVTGNSGGNEISSTTCEHGYYDAWQPFAITNCASSTKNLGAPCAGNCAGNPINSGWGNKFQRESDFSGNSLVLERFYNSWGHPAQGNLLNRWGAINWTSTFDRILLVYSSTWIVAYRPDGAVYSFGLNNGIWKAGADITDQLVQTSNGWQYTTPDGQTESYAATGNLPASAALLSITARNGYTQALNYNGANLLSNVIDSFGRQLTFGYDASNRITQMTDSNGSIYIYGYDTAGNLASVKYPDGKTRTYVYNEQSNTANTSLPNALTGIIDENGNRFATWKYDTQGRAISSEHDVWASNSSTPMPVEKVGITYNVSTLSDNGNQYTATTSSNVVSYNTDGVTPIVTRTPSFTNKLGVVKNTGTAQPCSTPGCGNATVQNATTYDANGNIASKTDFNGNQTTYQYDLTRNLETSRTEAYGTSLSRTITTQWHAIYRLPTLITEPGKTTSFTYDASGNVLSKTMTDTALSKSRTWSWTYNTVGQVLTANGPRTDVNDVTTYTYYSSASNVAGSVHSMGDLATVTNAVGLVTSITNYDLNGRPLSVVDPNGVMTTLTYWPRGWLKTRTVNGVQTTAYDYDGVGQLLKVTLPDASFLSYTYDTAHRLTDITDNAGNKTHYTLDAMGNRTREDTKDPSSAILKTRSRVFDALNRLQKDIGGSSPSTQITQYGYDNNGNLKTITDPLTHVTTNGYDALNRLITVTDPANGVATTTYNALDQTTQVKDPRLVTTNYTLNALGDVTLTQSPDSGTTNTVYDVAGNVIQKTDARGIVSTYTYDALNRLTGITYPANPSENLTFTYDDPSAGSYRIGRLASIGTANGSSFLVFSYDAYGNIALQADITTQLWGTSQYQYDSANRVKQIMYPSGRIVTYTRNTLGQITQVQTRDNASSAQQTIISNATYEPFGPLKSLTFGNGVTTTVAHDADYRVSRITTTALPIWDYGYSYDAAGNVKTLTDQSGTANKTFGYDNLNRVVADTNDTGAFTYQYDAGNNRTQLNIGGYLFPQTYASSSNRPTQFGSTPIVTDNAGNITNNDTTRAYNNANRLSQYTSGSATTTYQYTGLGQRDTKQGAQTFHYDYTPDGKYLSQLQLNANSSYNQGAEYLWLDDTPIAQIKTTYTTNNTAGTRRLTYIHADHLNTPRLMTDSTKKIVWKWSSDAYGLVAPNTNPDGDNVIDTLDLRFPGQIADSESGLFYNQNRYYDPLTGRYTQSDPIGLDGGLNTYSYVGNNPILYIDPTGLICTYSQATGRFVCPNGLDGTGYSGNGIGLNNPGAQGIPNTGPIPEGCYTVSAPYQDKKLGPFTRRLTPTSCPVPPKKENLCPAERDMNSFRIHADNHNKPPYSSSEGCIVVGPDLRKGYPIGETLCVVPF